MKNNNKGVTLIELIVAFAIVSVATIYFFQTVSLVKKMYANAREETNNYTNKTYAIRVLDSCIDNYIDNYGISEAVNICNIDGVGKIDSATPMGNGIYEIKIVDNKYKFYKYIKQ